MLEPDLTLWGASGAGGLDKAVISSSGHCIRWAIHWCFLCVRFLVTWPFDSTICCHRFLDAQKVVESAGSFLNLRGEKAAC